MNILPVDWDGNRARLVEGEEDHPAGAVQHRPGQTWPGRCWPSARSGSPTRRPEPMVPGTATVRDVVYAGAARCSSPISPMAPRKKKSCALRVPSAGQQPVSPGDRIGLTCPPEALLLYPEAEA